MPTIDYSPPVKRLLRPPVNRPDSKRELLAASVDSLFPQGFHHENAALCCLAALWLRHSYLDEAHKIAQTVKTTEGSYWHAIIHRLEKDYWNSKYWFERVGNHPIHKPLATEVAKMGARIPATLRDERSAWDSAAFVDFCETADRENEPDEGASRLRDQIAGFEWELLFDYCWDAAHER